jgi:citrate lyase subunit alpha/citrate CoA-transferase
MSNWEFVVNAVGRKVPTMVNGKKAIPYKGVGKHEPTGRKAAPPIRSCKDYPPSGNKVVGSIKEALQKCGIKDGMCIGNHHHFRNGDLVMNQVFAAADELGIKDLMWFPSAAFPCHKPLEKLMEKGVIHHIEGSLNGPLGDYASRGNMKGLAVLRSHGGRWRAVQDGDVHVDIAVIAAPAADSFGNANGVNGASACGSLFFGLVDTLYADHVIVVTDNLVEFPCVPWQIQGNNVDHVVQIDKVGEPEKIVSGTTVITKSPDRLLISEMTADFIEAAGILKNGFSFQSGAGGTALAFAIFLEEKMKEQNIKARFIRAGSTKYQVKMLEEGLTDYILDGQTFDLDGVRSMRDNPKHVATSPFTSYNWHGKGNFASMLDVVILGATEVDVNYNANVVTHSDGRMLHGIGGWQNCLAGKCVILPVPLFRNRIPIIVDEVTTICGPGELVDVIITERGIAINPLRKDLLKATEGSDLPFKTIQELKAEVEEISGGPPAKPELDYDTPVGVVEWVDGTVIDTCWKVL